MRPSDHESILPGTILWYVIPTEPAGFVPIGNHLKNGSVAGHYLASHDWRQDIDRRVECLACAVEQIRFLIPRDASTLNVFVAPEFYFHGPHGPYLWSGEDEDPIVYARERLQELFKREEFADWFFVCGTMLSAQTELTALELDGAFHLINESIGSLSQLYISLSQSADPVRQKQAVCLAKDIGNLVWRAHDLPDRLPVRNRAIMINNTSTTIGSEPHWPVMTMEKKRFSNQDLPLYNTGEGPVITEQMSCYPQISTEKGDLKQAPFDEFALLRLLDGEKPLNISVDICLDHLYFRLRETFTVDNQLLGDNYVRLQLIPSCNVELMSGAIVAGPGGYAFNCDGSYYFSKSGSKLPNTSWMNYRGNTIKLPFTNSLYPTGKYTYGGHTQLARVKSPAHGNQNLTMAELRAKDQALLDTDAVLEPIRNPGMCARPIVLPDFSTKYFAGGPGEVHIYGLHPPLEL